MKEWPAGTCPVSVVMISLNEAHNIGAVCDNLAGWAEAMFLVDSFSRDATIDIALERGIFVVQRRFRGFGDQWNFALRQLPIRTRWCMKLDPDERLSAELKRNLERAMSATAQGGLSMERRLWLMGKPLPVRQEIVRAWPTGTCRFTDVIVNEHPVVDGTITHVDGEIEHHDSPNLEHWLDKQNRYTSAEARMAYEGAPLGVRPNLLGDALQRRMWLKQHFHRLPLRFLLFFLYNWLVLGAWRAGRVGFMWARLRADVMRLIEYKLYEMRRTGQAPQPQALGAGAPDPRVRQYE
jgi:glycosyltransferase involved in cell wall biosynthesis